MSFNDANEALDPKANGGNGPIRSSSPASFGDAPTPPSVPDHELICRVGSGSYGDVWLARNVVGTLRAVKAVHRDNFSDIYPFEREFKGIQKYEPVSRSHDGLIDILQIGRDDNAGYFYYVMELADDAAPASPLQSPIDHQKSAILYTSRTLRSELRQRGRLPPDECLRVGLLLSSALNHLHSHGLVHRDIKPSNIIFVNGTAKLADIGLVADVDEARSFVGTVGFIPPEGPGTPQADVYGLGKVLYEMLTGKDRQEFPALPEEFQMRTPQRADPAVRAADGSNESRLLRGLNEIILRACESDVRLRYGSAQEMNEDLALLERGQPIRQKRGRSSISGARKYGMALGITVLVGTSILVATWKPSPPDFSGEGPPSTNDVANTLCDKAMKIIRNDEYAAFQRAYETFKQAIKLDNNFVRPYAGLLELRCREAVPNLEPMGPEEARLIARRLKELAPNLAPTHCAQAMVSYLDWDFAQAAKSLQKATEADPKYELGHTFYGYLLTICGWPDQGREQLEISRIHAPSKFHTLRFMGHTFFMQRKYTDALVWYRNARDLETNYSAAYVSLGDTYQAMDDYTNSMICYERAEVLDGGNSSEITRRYKDLRTAWEEGGVPGYWQEWWRWTEKQPDQDFYWKAEIQIRLGNTNAAFHWLNRSFQSHEPGETVHNLLIHECWDGLRDDPEFRKLLDKIGFSKVMPPRK